MQRLAPLFIPFQLLEDAFKLCPVMLGFAVRVAQAVSLVCRQLHTYS